MAKIVACFLATALVGLAMPAVAQTPALERYPACQHAAAVEDRRIVEICEAVDDLHERLAAYNSAHQRRVAELNFALSTALYAIGVRNDDLALEDAIAAARVAAAHYDSDRTRVRWAGAQLHIAGALNARARRGGAAYAREAAEVSRAAIAAIPRAQQPDLWAALHMALAHALMRIGQDGDRASLADAFTVIQSALEIYRAPRFADERARAEADLAWVQRALGEGNET